MEFMKLSKWINWCEEQQSAYTHSGRLPSWTLLTPTQVSSRDYKRSATLHSPPTYHSLLDVFSTHGVRLARSPQAQVHSEILYLILANLVISFKINCISAKRTWMWFYRSIYEISYFSFNSIKWQNSLNWIITWISHFKSTFYFILKILIRMK